MTRRVELGLAGVMVLAACGGGPSAPDAGDVPTGLTIAAAEPADGAQGVSVLADVVLTLSAAIDPASITSETVAVWLGFDPVHAEHRLPITTTWDAASRRLRIHPLAAWPRGGELRVELRGVADPTGALLVATVRFTAKASPWIRTVSLSGGDVVAYTQAQVAGGAGVIARTATYVGTGADLLWFTSDDALAQWELVDQRGDERRSKTVASPGTDGAWLTVDDLVTAFATEVMAGRQVARRVTWLGPGEDGRAFTTDDVLASYLQHDRDAVGRLVLTRTCTSPGADGAWLTGDDLCFPGSRYVYRERDGVLLREEFPTVGANPQPIFGWIGYEYDAAGRLAVARSYFDPGPDGVWLDADDRYTNVTVYDRSQPGHLAIRAVWPGPDGIYPSADDALLEYTRMDELAPGLPVRTARYISPGPDNVWETADDDSVDHAVSEYADDGSPRRYTVLVAPGHDGQWFTLDDIASQTQLFDTTR